MKYAIALCVICFFSIPSYAQIENYNFEDYRQATTRFRGLQTNPLLSSLLDDNHVLINNDRFSIRLDLPLTYFDQVNQPGRQSFLTANSRSNIGYSSAGDTLVDTRSVSLSQAINWNYMVDYYRNYNEWFLGYEWTGSLGYSYSSSEVSSSSGNPSGESYRRSPISGSSAGLRMGWGRIENISNAWHAFRILNRMHFTDQMEDQATIEQINAFGQFLDDIKTYRIFDSRLRDIALLQYIDGYLKDELDIEGDNIKYFTELNDMFRFGITANRIKGQKFTVVPGFRASYYGIDIENGLQNMDVDDIYFTAGPHLSVSYIRARPIKRDWQFNFGGNLISSLNYFKRTSEGTVQSEIEQRVRSAEGDLFALLAFYPTTRTEWTFTTRTSIWAGSQENNREWEYLGEQLQWSNELNYRYFINPWSTWQLGLAVRYQTAGNRGSVLGSFINPGIRAIEGGLDIRLNFTFSHIFF